MAPEPVLGISPDAASELVLGTTLGTTSDLVVGTWLVLVLVILASVLGAVERRERFAFVAGVGLFVLAHAAAPAGETAGVLLAVAGLVAVVASTVPLLRQSV